MADDLETLRLRAKARARMRARKAAGSPSGASEAVPGASGLGTAVEGAGGPPGGIPKATTVPPWAPSLAGELDAIQRAERQVANARVQEGFSRDFQRLVSEEMGRSGAIDRLWDSPEAAAQRVLERNVRMGADVRGRLTRERPPSMAESLAGEAVMTALDILQAPQHAVGAAANLLMGDTEGAAKALDTRSDLFPELQGTPFHAPAEFITDPLNLLVPEALPWLRKSGLPAMTAAEKEAASAAFDRARETALNELRRLREGKQFARAMTADNKAALERLISRVEKTASVEDLMAQMGSDEARQVAAEFTYPTGGPAGNLQGQAVIPAEGRAELVPAEVTRKQLTRGGRKNAYEGRPGLVPQQNETMRANLLEKPYVVDGEVGTVKAVQPNGSLVVELPGKRRVVVPIRPTVERPPSVTPVAAALDDAARAGDMAAATELVREVAKAEPAVGLSSAAKEAGTTNWTKKFDKVTGGFWSWFSEKFPATAVGIERMAKDRFSAFDREAGNAYGELLAARGDVPWTAKELTDPLRKSAKQAELSSDDMTNLFEWLSDRTDELSPTNKTVFGSRLEEASNYLNEVQRPKLNQMGALSNDALAEFHRWLPNLFPDEEGALKGAKVGNLARANMPKLRTSNADGILLRNVTKDEAKDLLDSLGISHGGRIGPGQAAVVSKGKYTAIKLNDVETREHVFNALDSLRRQAGDSRIKMSRFDRIPDEVLREKGLKTDPFDLLEYSIRRSGDEIANREFLEKMVRYSEPFDKENPLKTGWKEFSADPRWGALSNRQVPQQLYDALTEYDAQKGWPTRIFRTAIKVFKKNKIVRPATWFRQFGYSLGPLNMLNNVNPATLEGRNAIVEGTRDALAMYGKGERSEFTKEAMRAGLQMSSQVRTDIEGSHRLRQLFRGNKGPTAEEILENIGQMSTGSGLAFSEGRQTVGKRAARFVAGAAKETARSMTMGEDAATTAVRAATGGAASEGWSGMLRGIANNFGFADDLNKAMSMRRWFAEAERKFPNWSRKMKLEWAARRVNALTQNYEQTAALAQTLSDSGIVPFGRFWGEYARNHWNALRYNPGGAMMSLATNKAIMAGGVGYLIAQGVPWERIKEYLAQNPGKTPVMAYKEASKDGKEGWTIEGIDTGWTFPDVTESLMAPGETANALVTASPFISTAAEMGALALAPSENPKRLFGNARILEKGEPRKAAMLRTMWDTFGSPMGAGGRDTRTIGNAAQNLFPSMRDALPEQLQSNTFKNQYEDAPTPVRDLFGVFFGVKSVTDPEGRREENILYDFDSEVRNAEQELNSALGDVNLVDKNGKPLPDTDPRVTRLYDNYYKRVSKAAKAALDAGIPEKDLNLEKEVLDLLGRSKRKLSK